MRFAAILILFFVSTTLADEAVKHNLSISGGIAHPSTALAISQNPAGLIYGKATKVHLSLEQGEDKGPAGLGGGILSGSESVGGGAYLRDYNTDPGSVSKIYLFNIGLGVMFSPINSAIGIGTSKNLGSRDPIDTTNSCSNWCVDAGLIVNPNGDFRIAGNVVQLSDSNYLIGGGIAADASENITFVIDAQANSQKSTLVAKPGIGIFISGIQLTGSYGFRAWGTQEAGMRQGWSGGISTEFIPNMLLEAYMNQFTHYYFSATLQL